MKHWQIFPVGPAFDHKETQKINAKSHSCSIFPFKTVTQKAAVATCATSSSTIKAQQAFFRDDLPTKI